MQSDNPAGEIFHPAAPAWIPRHAAALIPLIRDGLEDGGFTEKIFEAKRAMIKIISEVSQEQICAAQHDIINGVIIRSDRDAERK